MSKRAASPQPKEDQPDTARLRMDSKPEGGQDGEDHRHGEVAGDGEEKQLQSPQDETEIDIFAEHGFMFPMHELHDLDDLSDKRGFFNQAITSWICGLSGRVRKAAGISDEDRHLWAELQKVVFQKEFQTGPVLSSAWRNRVKILEWLAPNAGNPARFFDFMVKSMKEAKADATEIPSTVQSRLFQHWRDNYVGASLSALKETLVSYEGEWDTVGKNAYSKTLGIVQSSGMGKSRLADELGKEWYQFPFVFRTSGEPGYPSCDTAILRFLHNGNFPVASARALAFFAAIGRMGTEFWTHPTNTYLPAADVVESWHSMLAPTPHSSVPGGMNFDSRSKDRVDRYGSLAQYAEEAYRRIEQAVPGIAQTTDVMTGDISETDFANNKTLKQIVLVPLQSMCDAIRNHGRTAHTSAHRREPSVLLVLDEFANLDSSVRLSLRRLSRVWGALPIWILLLSTNNSVAAIHGVRKNEPSSRVANSEKVRLPPMIGLPLDCEDIRVMSNPAEREEELKLSLQQISTVKHLSMFGRPLWRIYEDLSYQSMMEFAIHKLLGGKTLEIRNEHQIFALLAARIGLDPVLAEKSLEFITESVSQFLRIVVAMDDESGMMKTVTPSEPVVADAAAALLMKNAVWDAKKGPNTKTRLWPIALDVLENELLSTCLVEKGTQGEMYARILCVLARDYAVQTSVLSENPNPANGPDDHEYMDWSSPVTLLEFLQQLLPKGEYDKLIGFSISTPPKTSKRGSDKPLEQHDGPPADAPELHTGSAVPLRPPAITFAESVKDAHLNFSHFVSTDRSLSPDTTVDLMHDLIRRCAALQLSKGQPAWDMLIPLYYGDPAHEFDPAKLSALLLQVKNVKDKAHKLHLGARTTLNMIKLPANRPPIVTIMMDLDVDHKPLIVQLKEVRGGPVWGINLSGAGAATYRAVDHKDLGGTCEALLATLKSTDSINDTICQQNYRFCAHGRDEKYKLAPTAAAGSSPGLPDGEYPTRAS